MSRSTTAKVVFVQTIRHRDYFLPPGDTADDGAHAAPPSLPHTWASFALLLVSLVAVVGLAKVLSPVIETGVDSVGAPKAVIGVAIAALVLLPEAAAALRAALADRLQASMNLALGSALGDVVYAMVAVSLVSTTSLGGQAMIIAFIAQSCVIAASTITAVPWRAWLWPVRVTKARLRDLLRFGAPVTGEIVLSEGARYWDKPLMLRLLGAHDAGSYGMAFNLAQLPAVYVGGHVGAVMMPAVVRALPGERPALMVRALAFAALFLFPMAAGLAACAPTLVATLLPATWRQVAPLLSVLAIASLPAAGSFILSSFLAAHARNHRLMWIEAATVVWPSASASTVRRKMAAASSRVRPTGVNNVMLCRSTARSIARCKVAMSGMLSTSMPSSL